MSTENGKVTFEITETKRIVVDDDPETIAAFEAGGWHLVSDEPTWEETKAVEDGLVYNDDEEEFTDFDMSRR